MSEPILTVANMNKKFGSTVALNDVSLTVYPGEIRGLIGENGSGKSTVTSIVAGMQECDSGAMTFQGQSWKPLSMIDALHKGIGMIVQESGTIPGITVAENIFLAESEKYKNKFGLINRKKMNADATRVMKNIGVNDVTGEDVKYSLERVAGLLDGTPLVATLQTIQASVMPVERKPYFGMMTSRKLYRSVCLYIMNRHSH